MGGPTSQGDEKAFSCEVICERDDVRVAAVAEFDIASAPELQQIVRELRASGLDHIVIDLRGLSLIRFDRHRDLRSAALADGHRLNLIPAARDGQRLFERTDTLAWIT
jgi:hypothetical protein